MLYSLRISFRNYSICHNILGLHIGNKLKQGLDIPDWIKSESSYQIACIRGLMDTDGCIFYERHRINGKVYSYPRLSIVSYSSALRKSICEILASLGFSPRERGNRSVQLENIQQIQQYFNVVGTHNPKHFNRFKLG